MGGAYPYCGVQEGLVPDLSKVWVSGAKIKRKEEGIRMLKGKRGFTFPKTHIFTLGGC